MRTFAGLGSLLALVAGLVIPSAPTSAQAPTAPQRKLELSFDAGRVTLVAHNVTLREILAEWGRVGSSTIENAQTLTGGPMSIEFKEKPEVDVLVSLLRDAPGFILEPRKVGVAGASQLQAVHIQPKAAVTGMASSMPSYTTSSPQAVQLISSTPDQDLPPVERVPNGDKPTPSPTATPSPQAGQPLLLNPFVAPGSTPKPTPSPTTTPTGGRGGRD